MNNVDIRPALFSPSTQIIIEVNTATGSPSPHTHIPFNLQGGPQPMASLGQLPSELSLLSLPPSAPAPLRVSYLALSARSVQEVAAECHRLK